MQTRKSIRQWPAVNFSRPGNILDSFYYFMQVRRVSQDMKVFWAGTSLDIVLSQTIAIK